MNKRKTKKKKLYLLFEVSETPDVIIGIFSRRKKALKVIQKHPRHPFILYEIERDCYRAPGKMPRMNAFWETHQHYHEIPAAVWYWNDEEETMARVDPLVHFVMTEKSYKDNLYSYLRSLDEDLQRIILVNNSTEAQKEVVLFLFLDKAALPPAPPKFTLPKEIQVRPVYLPLAGIESFLKGDPLDNWAFSQETLDLSVELPPELLE